MRECHPALHLDGCTANQTGSSHALQLTKQSAQQHLIQGLTDKHGGVPVNGWMGVWVVFKAWMSGIEGQRVCWPVARGTIWRTWGENEA